MKRFDRKFGAKFLSSLPTCPGVYRIFDAAGALIYVGKAKNLRRRLGQYKNAKRIKRHRKMIRIVKDAARIEWEVFDTDLTACLEETRLIRTLRPKWNVEGAFAFLYPLVGLRHEGEQTYFVLTTLPKHFPEYRFYGAFRSRYLTGNAFFGLMKMLKFLGHPVPRRQLGAEGDHERSYVFAFRRLPPVFRDLWADFFLGKSHEALSQLVLSLLEKASARALRADVDEWIKDLERFYKHEAMRLAKAIEATAYGVYPVSQDERDSLFLRYRLRENG